MSLVVESPLHMHWLLLLLVLLVLFSYSKSWWHNSDGRKLSLPQASEEKDINFLCCLPAAHTSQMILSDGNPGLGAMKQPGARPSVEKQCCLQEEWGWGQPVGWLAQE